MIVIGVDPSMRSTGIVAYEYGTRIGMPGKILEARVVGSPMSHLARVSDRMKRLQEISDAVGEYVGRFEPYAVVVEGPSYGSIGRQTELGGLRWLIYDRVYRAGGRVAEIPPKQARKAVFGVGSPPKGIKDKPWIKAELIKIFESEVPKNEHLRDALLVARAFEILGPSEIDCG